MTTSRANSGPGAAKPGSKIKPAVFGRYLLLDRVAAGGMAEVWRAKVFGADDFQRIIAIKKILPHVVEDPEFIQMFKDEAKITVQLQHANIGQVLELNKVDDAFYIAMEYVSGKDGKTLWNYQRSRNEPLPVPMACNIVQKMSEGLDYAHRKKDNFGVDLKIVHRDVSPQNVLISWEGEVKIIDFGIAKAAGKGSKTQAGILKGKFGYMAPEQVRGMPIDQRADVFALGVCLYEFVTGERAFVADSDFSLLEMVRNVEIKPPSLANANVPPEVERIIYKAMAKDPDDRYQWGSDLSEDLQRFLLMQGKAPTRHDLAEYLKACFPADYDRERLRMESYRDLEMPEIPVAAAPAPAAAAQPDGANAAVMAAMADDGPSGSFNEPAHTVPARGSANARQDVTGGRMQVPGRQVTGIRPMAQANVPTPAPVVAEEPTPEKGNTGKLVIIAACVVAAILAIFVIIGVVLKGSGTIAVTTKPSGAEILLDGSPVGVTASGDLMLEGVKSGQHLLKVQKERYLAQTTMVTVQRNAIARLELILDKEPDPTGEVNLKTKPGGAEIWLDGARRDEKTPAILELTEGPHTIELRLPKHKRVEIKANVAKDSKTSHDVGMKPELVDVEIRSSPAGAKIYDRGKQLLGTTPFKYSDLSVDPPFPEITLKYSGCQDQKTSLTPDESQGVEQTKVIELKCR